EANAPPRRPDRRVEVALRAKLAAGPDDQRQRRELAARRAEGDLAGARGVEGRVVARADERRGRLVGLEERRAVERDRAARVSADLRVRDDAVGIEPGLARRELQLILRQAHEDERRPQRLRVRALGEGRVEHLLLDVHGAAGPAVLVAEAAAAAPR